MSFVATAADVRSASRSLCRAPWYAATSISVIALSVTLTATILAITNGALFEPLPYAEEGPVRDVRRGVELRAAQRRRGKLPHVDPPPDPGDGARRST
jgi:hypothetical protein